MQKAISTKRAALLPLPVAIGTGLLAFVFRADLSKLVDQIFSSEKTLNQALVDTRKSFEKYRGKNFPLPFPLPDEPTNSKTQAPVSLPKPSDNDKPFVQQYFELTALAKAGDTKAAIAAFELLDRCHMLANFSKRVDERSTEEREEVPPGQEQIAHQKRLESQCPTLSPAIIDSRASILSTALDAGDLQIASVAYYAGPGFDIEPNLDDADPKMVALRNDPRLVAWAKKVIPLLDKAALTGDKYALFALMAVYDPRGYGYLREDNVFQYALMTLVFAHLAPNSARLLESSLVTDALNNLSAEQQAKAKLDAKKVVSTCCSTNNQPARYQQITIPPYIWASGSGL